ncbi:MAG TPA: response regulator [Thermodesulfobacteriota bacterium]|nr:response regulator [Thermodesulfobacteriota bacterium]
MANEKILVVEDERNFAQYLNSILKSLGYNVVGIARSGEEAIKNVAETEPDLVLMDITLKGNIDGVSVAERICANFDVPVVYLTAHSEDDIFKRAKVTEPFGYLLKPFEKKELRTTIEIALYRHKLEKRLKESERWLSTTLKSIGDAVIATDADGFIRFINPVAESLTGWKQEEALGKDLKGVFNIINEETRAVVESPVEKAVREGAVTGLANHTILISKYGTEIPIADSAAPIKDERGNISGVVLVFRDVTTQRHMEESLRKAHDELEIQVQERTAELKKANQALEAEIAERKRMQEELIKTQKLESLGILAGGIAHDFNNFLTTILGNVSLIRMYTDPENKMYKRLIEAEKACLRAKDLTGQLLTFSKGGAPVKKAIFSIGDLVRESAYFALRGSNVGCESSIPENLWLTEVDEGQISQVIHNLVINAQQAMPEGGVVRITLENITVDPEGRPPLKAGGKYIKITVEDKGTGIPEGYLSKIFDPYFTTKQKGSGLGLTTVYSIVKSHDGYVEVESQLQVGSKFYIYLPAISEEQTRKEEEKKAKVIKGNGKVLIMDDEELIRDVAGEMLGQLGYEVEFAKNGSEAIELYTSAMESSKSFNLVIMDLTIPGGMGGKETIEKLKEIDPKIKAIVSSGYFNDPVMAEYKNYGFKGVVTKPYKIEEFSKTVYEVINQE